MELDGELAVARVLYARALDGVGKLDDAVFQLLRAAKLRPDDAAVLREVGSAFYKKGLYDKALQWLLKAKTAASGDPKEEARALYAVGLAQEARRDTGAAILAYREAIEKDPRHLDARKTLADALAGLGEHERAIVVLDELLDVDPTNERAAGNREVLERALVEMRARRLVGKTEREVETSALVQAGQMKRKGRGLFGLRKEPTEGAREVRYASALAELYVRFDEGGKIASLFFGLTDPDAASKKRDAAYQVTVVAKDGRREPATFATAASTTFLREALGTPMTEAAALYARLLGGAASVEYGGVRASFASRGTPEGDVHGLLVEPST